MVAQKKKWEEGGRPISQEIDSFHICTLAIYLHSRIPERFQKDLFEAIQQHNIEAQIISDHFLVLEKYPTCLCVLPTKVISVDGQETLWKSEDDQFLCLFKFASECGWWQIVTQSAPIVEWLWLWRQLASCSTDLGKVIPLLLQSVVQLPLGFTLVDSEGKILYANIEEAAQHGYEPKDLLNQDVGILAPLRHPLNTSEKEAKPKWIRKSINRHRNGSLYSVLLSSTLLHDSKEQVLGSCTTSQKCKDLTHLMVADKALESNLNTRPKEDILDSLYFAFSMLRHEIANPLNSIKAIAYTLVKCKGQTEEQIQRHGQNLLEVSQHIDYLLKQLKQVNIFDTIAQEPFEVISWIQKLVDQYQYLLQEKHICLNLYLPEEEVWVVGDSQAFGHVLFNLLNNAKDAVLERAQPEIRVTCEIESEQHQVLIEISDNGVGISEEDQKNLFKPFFTTKKHGTGLGLVLARKIVVQMGGSLDISSTFGVGTTVRIALPICWDQPSEEAAPKTPR